MKRKVNELLDTWVNVTTPSAKADGFCRHARTTVPRFADNAQSERQNITSGVDISVNDQPAVRAIMNTVSQSFRYIRQATTTGACLRRVTGVYLDKLPTSFLHFVGEFGKEHPPSRIVDRLRQHPTSQTLDIQILNGNQTIVIRYLPTDLVVKIRPLIPDMRVRLLEQTDGLAPAFAAFPSPGDASLCCPECRLAMTVVAWVLYQLTIGQGGKGRESHVNSDSVRQRRRWIHTDNHAETGIPLTSLTLEGERLNLAGDRPVHLQLDETDTLQLKPVVVRNVATISPGREGITVEAVPTLKPGVAGFSPSLHPAEESPESLVDPPEHVLAGRIVGKSQVASIPYLLELVGLVVVVARYAVSAPSVSALLESRVIQGPGFRQLILQSFGLLTVGIQTVLKSSTQKLKPSFTNFATRYNDKAGIGRLHDHDITGKEVSANSSAS